MEQITLSAYAKINLTLSITGKRTDGYHTLESVMQEISLADTVTLRPIPSGILLSCNWQDIPCDERNLCWKAAKRYLEATGIHRGVAIQLIKKIPHGAGLGGGSSDAAAVLKGMQALYPSEADLFPIAESLGADVPFFLKGKTQFCTGIGQDLSPVFFLKKRSLFAVIAKNCPGLSTPEIYALFDQTAPEQSIRQSEEALRRVFASPDLSALFSHIKNDLEIPAVLLRPEIALLKEEFLHCGAECAMMTGSGSAVFALFDSEKSARDCAKYLSQKGTDTFFSTLL